LIQQAVIAENYCIDWRIESCLANCSAFAIRNSETRQHFYTSNQEEDLPADLSSMWDRLQQVIETYDPFVTPNGSFRFVITVSEEYIGTPRLSASTHSVLYGGI